MIGSITDLIQEGKIEEAERTINGIVAFSLEDVYNEINENRSRIDRNEETAEYAADIADNNRSLIEDSRTRGGRADKKAKDDKCCIIL